VGEATLQNGDLAVDCLYSGPLFTKAVDEQSRKTVGNSAADS
jgi:hypothetical protein